MKVKIVSLSLFLFLLSGSAVASGVPVVDVASIAKTVEEGLNRAREAASQIEQLKQQYDQQVSYAEDQKKRLEGFTDFSNGFDSASSYMKNSLSDVTNSAKSDLGGLRNQYGLTNSDKDIQAANDGILQKIKFYDNFNNDLNQRANRLTRLQQSYSSASTPQQKADLANQLSTEKMTLDLQLKQFDIADRQMQSEEEARQQAFRQNFFKSAFQSK